MHADDESAFRSACSKGHEEVVQELLALDRERWIDVHAKGDLAFRAASNQSHVNVVKLLLTSGMDRLPSADAFAEALIQWNDFPGLQTWRMHWKNRPRAAYMVEWRATVEAQRGLGRIGWCCEDGRPLELDRSLHILGAIRFLTRDDLVKWSEVAKERGHDGCVKVLTEAIAMTT